MNKEIKLFGAAEDNGETTTHLGTFSTWREAIAFLNDDLQGKHSKHDWWTDGKTTEPWAFYSIHAKEPLTNGKFLETGFYFCACEEVSHEESKQEAQRGS